MSSDPTIVEALGSTDLFGALKPRALKKIAGAMKTTHHEAGKPLTTQGHDGIAFHLILDGKAIVTVAGHTGHEIGPGDYFGEISMIDGEPRSATVTATTPLTTAALTAWEFRPLINEEPEVARALLVALCARLRKSEQADPA
jgi:CRP/FNR family transcriptional regulator, cyclic AMP receptor protein